MSIARRTAADRRKLRQDNVNLEFLIRRTRRTIRNESPTVVDRLKKPPAIADVKVAMSKHAMQRCQLMQIDPELVRVMVARPAITYAQREGRWIAQHAEQNVAAIFADTDDIRTVVTVLFREPFSRSIPQQMQR